MAELQDGCHHQVKWEWMSLSQIELVWVRVRVEWECFWVNLREDNKVSWIQDGSVWIQHGRIQDGCHHQVESEWMSEVFFVQNGWIEDGRIQDGNQVKWEWEFESDWISLSQSHSRVRVFLSESERWKQGVWIRSLADFKMPAIIKLSQNEWVKLFLCKWWELILASVSEFERKN